MKALIVTPGTAGSARLAEIDEPPRSDGEILVATHAIGVCGTDREIIDATYGLAPPGADHLVLGHESIGRVVEAPASSGLRTGDWVVGIVRRPDPVPCSSCAVGEWDMCQNGQFTERGIKGLHGFGSERYRISAAFAVKVDPRLGELGVLLEPTSIVAKAWEHIERIAARAAVGPRRVLITGAGPIGLLAALLARQRQLEVVVLDRATGGAKPALVEALGARYTTGAVPDESCRADVIIECTGASAVIFDAITNVRPNATVCLTGVSSRGAKRPIDIGALNRGWVFENNVVFGTVNANRRHYEAAAQALATADRRWLERVITRRVELPRWAEALAHDPDGVKSVLVFAGDR